MHRAALLVVRPSVTLTYRGTGHMSWVSSKVITRNSSEPQHRQSSPTGTTPKFGWNRGGVAVLSRKTAISLKRGQTARHGQSYYWWLIVSRIRAFDWCQNQRPWMTLNGHYAIHGPTRRSDCMRESTAAIVASVVETTRQPGRSSSATLSQPWANLLHQTCIAGLVKHLSPYIGRISEWMAFAPSSFAYRKRIRERYSSPGEEHN